MSNEIMKPTVFGSKWASFESGNNMCEWFFPRKNIEPYIRSGHESWIDITILQIKVTPCDDKVVYTVEYIERY